MILIWLLLVTKVGPAETVIVKMPAPFEVTDLRPIVLRPIVLLGSVTFQAVPEAHVAVPVTPVVVSVTVNTLMPASPPSPGSLTPTVNIQLVFPCLAPVRLVNLKSVSDDCTVTVEVVKVSVVAGKVPAVSVSVTTRRSWSPAMVAEVV